MAESLGVRFEESFSFQGGTVRVGRAAQKGQDGLVTDLLTLAAWSGSRHAMVAHMDDAVTSADALRLLNTVAITEHDDGIVIAPKAASNAVFYEPVRSTRVIPELGIVEAKSREARTVKALPPWEGARVQAGELFRDSMSNGAPYLVLATPSAVVTIVPRAGQRFDDVVQATAAGFSVETLA
jgi:hypothetical protein